MPSVKKTRFVIAVPDLVKICKAIRNEPWGMHEFGVVTADGHRIMVASSLQ
jgi:hypothetical protein